MAFFYNGLQRLEHLADNGPTAFAFTFKQRFHPDGSIYEIDRARVKAIAIRNAEGQQDLMQVLTNIPA